MHQPTKSTTSPPTNKHIHTCAQHFWWRDILLLSIILSIFFGILNGVRPLSVPDEARYSEIPREMVMTGDYVTPRLNTIKYFEKPALFYWAQAGAIHLFGLSEWVVRLPTLLLGVLGCLVTYATTRMLFDRRSGWFASLLLSTSILYFAMAHTITLDMAISVFMTLCLSAFIVAIDMPTGSTRKILLGSVYVFAAFAMLTKGLVGILLPATIVGSWMLLCHQWRLLLKMQLISGIFIFLIIALPWHILVQQANPEFFHFYFIEQQFLRYLTLYASRYQPNWFFIPILLLGFFPWIVFLFQAIRYHWPSSWKERITHKKPIFLMLWASIIFIFFSFSKSKLIPYILPVFPPLAMLVGHYLSDHLEKEPTIFRKPFLSLLCISCIISIALVALPYFDQVNDVQQATFLLRSMAVWLVIGVSCATFYAYRGSIKKALAILLVTAGISLIFVNLTVAAIDTRSIKPLALALKEKLHSGDQVVMYHHYYQDLPFYLQQRITVVDCCGELYFGMQHQNTSEFMIKDTDFWQQWNGTKKVYAIMSVDKYEALKSSHKNMHLLAKTKDNVLIGN